MTEFKTTGQIATQLDVPRDTVQHIVRTREIEPDAKAGGYGLYAPATVKRIASEITAIKNTTAQRGTATRSRR